MEAGKLEIRESLAVDAEELLRTMRADDLAELAVVAPRLSPAEALSAGLRGAECWTATVGGRVLAMFGVSEHRTSILGDRIGIGWLLTSELVESHKQLFMSGCEVALEDLLSRWDVLVNVIDARYTRALRWARRLGFELQDPVPSEGGVVVPFSVRMEGLPWAQRS